MPKSRESLRDMDFRTSTKQAGLMLDFFYDWDGELGHDSRNRCECGSLVGSGSSWNGNVPRRIQSGRTLPGWCAAGSREKELQTGES